MVSPARRCAVTAGHGRGRSGLRPQAPSEDGEGPGPGRRGGRCPRPSGGPLRTVVASIQCATPATPTGVGGSDASQIATAIVAHGSAVNATNGGAPGGGQRSFGFPATVEDLPRGPVAVVGLGVSGRAVARYLLARGAVVVGFDDRPILPADAVLAELRNVGLEVRSGPGAVTGLDRFATVFVTPGMRKDHPALVLARAAGALLTGEIPFVLEHARVPVIAITGSSGKTTTTTLVGAILRETGIDAFVGGNIGTPGIDALSAKDAPAVIVLELSSFQLDLCRVSPHIAALLNLAPNHLDVHPDMDDYRRAKLQVLRHQGRSDVAVLAADHPVQGAAAAGLGRRLWFGVDPARVPEGATVVGEHLVWRRDGVEHILLRRDQVVVPGRHNLENVLAATAIAMAAGASPEAVETAVRAFTGVAHRLQVVHRAGGVTYIDDSIATAPDRTIAALAAIEGPVVLIAGGSDKGLDYEGLGTHLRVRVRVLITVGPTGPAIGRASMAAGGPAPVACGDLVEAVREARRRVRPGDTVLLAPASASFDQFPNYAARGDAFRRLVQAEDEPGGRRAGHALGRNAK